MTTKDRLLALLENNIGSFLSGEEIAQTLSLSRTSVWKAIKTLESEGYNIKAVTNKGYCLSADSDILSKSGILKYLDNPSLFDVQVFKTIDSTNTALRKIAMENGKEGMIYAASEQTKGKGRRGRDFYSPENSGIYFSLLLRPQGYDMEKASSVTTMAAAAVSLAMDHVFNVNSKIKWVNDIFVDNKKVCGILTEANYDLESHSMDFAVLGIGINIYSPDNSFPKELREIAGFLSKEKITEGKNRLLAETINNFWKFYTSKNDEEYLSIYRKKSLVLGKNIYILSPEGKKKAKAVSIDDHCHLIVEYPDKQKETLSSGEISIRL